MHVRISSLCWLVVLASCGAPRATPALAPAAPAQTPAAAADTGPALAKDTPKPTGPIAGVLDAAPEPKDDLDKRPVDFQFDARIPMRDGVHLGARIYRPIDATGPVPAVFVKTPYNASGYHSYGMYFARRGYAVALVDARGRGNSDGEFRALETDGVDGHDVVEWLAAQPWCDGKIGMFGGSYDGFGQWATFKERPAHLRTIVPVASVGPAIDFPFWNGVSYPYVVRWLTYVSGRTLNGWMFADETLWHPAAQAAAMGKSPFSKLDDQVGNPSPTFQTWLQHPSLDEFWRAKMPAPADWKRDPMPILSITGHWDDDQPGAMHYYLSHMKYGSKRAVQQHYLVLGPWDHGGTRRPAAELGGLRVGAGSVLDMMELHLAWYDWTLKDKKRPSFLRKRVAYYVVGANEWRYGDALADVASGEMTLYLDSDGRADDVVHSGRLVASPPKAVGTDTYRFDPLDPRFADPAADVGLDVPIVNRRDGATLPGAALVYHSAPFDKDTDIAGSARLSLAVEMDVPDTDFWVGLFEVRPDGQTLLLTNTILRARAQGGLKKPGQRFVYTIDDFWYFAYRVGRGSRLRLVITPPVGSSWQRNFQSGGVVADETAADARAGVIQVHRGGSNGSALTLGVTRTEPK